MEISLRICMWILGLKGLTQYKTSKKRSQNKQNVTESCLPKGQAGIEALWSPALSPLTPEIRDLSLNKMHEKFLT